jgi:hypothetical protein
MSYHYPMMILNTTIMVTILVVGFIRLPHMDTGMKIFYLLNVAGFFGELAAYLSAIYLKTNALAYAILNLFNVVVFCLYFNYIIPFFQKHGIGYMIAIPGLLFGVFNLINVGSKRNINIYFMMYMAFVIIAMSMISLADVVINFNKARKEQPHHTWIPIALTFLWTSLFLSWGLYNELNELLENKWMVDFTIFVVNILVNSTFLVIFFKFPKTAKYI